MPFVNQFSERMRQWIADSTVHHPLIAETIKQTGRERRTPKADQKQDQIKAS